MGCAQEGLQPGRGYYVTTLSEDEGNARPAVQKDAQVVIVRTQF